MAAKPENWSAVKSSSGSGSPPNRRTYSLYPAVMTSALASATSTSLAWSATCASFTFRPPVGAWPAFAVEE
eukprot:5250431-Lingulodinium_polyedra.AAC.1